MLEHEEAERIVPGMPKDQILKILRRLYPPFKEKLGVFAIELESFKKKKNNSNSVKIQPWFQTFL